VKWNGTRSDVLALVGVGDALSTMNVKCLSECMLSSPLHIVLYTTREALSQLLCRGSSVAEIYLVWKSRCQYNGRGAYIVDFGADYYT
jgi:hypothetical protein